MILSPRWGALSTSLRREGGAPGPFSAGAPAAASAVSSWPRAAALKHPALGPSFASAGPSRLNWPGGASWTRKSPGTDAFRPASPLPRRARLPGLLVLGAARPTPANSSPATSEERPARSTGPADGVGVGGKRRIIWPTTAPGVHDGAGDEYPLLPSYYCKGCVEDGVTKPKRPIFGPPDGEPVHCKTHVKPGEVDVVHVMCPGCLLKGVRRRVSFGLPGGRPAHCVACKKDGEVDLVSAKCKTCKAAGILTLASFGPVGGRKVHCARCRKEGEVDLYHPKCVTCRAAGVLTRANFGPVGGRPVHCGECKEVGEVDLCHPKCVKCKLAGVLTRASFGPVCGSPLHCGECKEDGEVDVVHRMCSICLVRNPPQHVRAGYGPTGQADALLHAPRQLRQPGRRHVRLLLKGRRGDGGVLRAPWREAATLFQAPVGRLCEPQSGKGEKGPSCLLGLRLPTVAPFVFPASTTRSYARY